MFRPKEDSGFELDPHKEFLIKIAREVASIRENLKTLCIHTANIKNVTLKEFEYLMKLAVELTDIMFEDFSLQCANWKFYKGQPTFK